MLEEFNGSMGKIGDMMASDDARQKELLRLKLEARKNRRQKLLEQLKKAEANVDGQEKDLKAKRVDILNGVQNEYQVLQEELEAQEDRDKKANEEDLARLKQEKLQAFEDNLKGADSRDFNKCLEDFQNAQKRVDNELLKERAKQDSDLEKALKQRRAHRQAQIDKEKHDALGELQGQHDQNSAAAKQEVKMLREMLNLEGGHQNERALENIEKIKAQQAKPANKLMESMQRAILARMEAAKNDFKEENRKRRILREREVDDLDKGVAAAKVVLNQRLDEKDKIRDQLKGKLDESERAQLMARLGEINGLMEKSLDGDKANSDNRLQAALAARKKRRDELAAEERKTKKKQERQVIENEGERERLEKHAFKANTRELEMLIEQMKLTLSPEELPFAIQRVVEERHQDDLNDVLVGLFKQKAKELNEEVLGLLEQKYYMENTVHMNLNDQLELIDSLEKRLGDDLDAEQRAAEVQRLEDRRVALRRKAEEELMRIGFDTQDKECGLESKISDRYIGKETEALAGMREAHATEARDIFTKYLPETMLKDAMLQLGEEELREIEEFKRQQEADRKAKLEAMEKQRIVIREEMEKQRQRL